MIGVQLDKTGEEDKPRIKLVLTSFKGPMCVTSAPDKQGIRGRWDKGRENYEALVSFIGREVLARACGLGVEGTRIRGVLLAFVSIMRPLLEFLSIVMLEELEELEEFDGQGVGVGGENGENEEIGEGGAEKIKIEGGAMSAVKIEEKGIEGIEGELSIRPLHATFREGQPLSVPCVLCAIDRLVPPQPKQTQAQKGGLGSADSEQRTEPIGYIEVYPLPDTVGMRVLVKGANSAGIIIQKEVDLSQGQGEGEGDEEVKEEGRRMGVRDRKKRLITELTDFVM